MKNRTLVWIVLALLTAAVLRLYRIDVQSIWFDEGWSAHAAAQPTFIDAWNADATNPPLYYALLHVAARFFGTSEFALRFFSFAWGMIATALAVHLSGVLFGKQARLWALWAAVLSAPLWWASQEARMYTFMAVLVAVAALAWTHLKQDEKPTRFWWVALWLSELALLYTHNTGLVVAIWLNAVTLIAWALRRNLKQPEWHIWTAGQFIVGLLWLPYFLTRFLELREANSAITSAPTLTGEFLLQVAASFWIAPWSPHIRGTWGLITILSFLTLYLLTIALIGMVRARWIAFHVVLLTFGVLAGLIVLGNEFHGRYMVMIVPLVIAGIGGFRAAFVRASVVISSVVVLIITFALAPENMHDDVRGVVSEYAEQLTDGDTVLAWSYADRYELAYYWDRLGVTANRVTLPEGEDLEAILPLLPTSGDVALNVWYTQRADYRGMMDCLLSAGATLRIQSVLRAGMNNLFYEQPQIRAPEWNAVNWTFRDQNGDGTSSDVARIDAVGTLFSGTADRPLCIPIELTLLRDLSVDLKARLIILNEFGWETPTWGRVEAIFADAAQRTTSMQPEGEIRAFALVRLSPGTPPGEYSVYLRVYDEDANFSGYLPPSNAEIAYGRDVKIGTWTITAGANWQTRANEDISPRFSDDLFLLTTQLVVPIGNQCRVRSGDEIRLALGWVGTDALPDWILTTSDDAQTIIPPIVTIHDDYTRDERAIRIPLDAPSGEAVITLPDGHEVLRCQIEAIPMQTEVPTFDQPANAEFPDIGALIGWTLNGSRMVQLVWRAEGASDISYTVFVQMIDSTGNVVAQSDSIPLGGSRPTTGWRAGEYIEDRMILTPNVPTFSGEVTLIAGLYDAATGTRVRLADGTDHAVLMEGLATAW